MKKSILHFSLLIIGILFLFSCNKSDLGIKSGVQSENLTGTIGEQLSLTKEALTAKKLPLKIIGYKTSSIIENDHDAIAIKQQLVNSNAIVPQFDGENISSFSLSTVAQRMTAYSSSKDEQENVVKNIGDIAFPMIKTGQKVLDITWESNGRQFNSTCVYGDEGVVYDNVLSNICFVEKENPLMSETPAILNERISDVREGARSLAQYSFTSTVLNYTITWVWGGTRGKIIIKHYIIWNGSNYIIDHGGTTDAWMSAGSASGRWANNALVRNSRSKMAWGYGWATPTASFNISFNSSNLTFSTGTSGVGSKGSGSGVHTIYI